MPASAPAAPADYRLQGPTTQSVLASLSEHMSAAEAQAEWTAACNAAGVTYPPTTDQQMLQAIEALSERPGLTGICGMAIRIRARAALRLARTTDSAPPPGGR